MALILNKGVIEDLVEGSAFYSCGGGLEKETNKKMCLEAIKKRKVAIKSLSELKKQSVLGVVYAVGKPEKRRYNFKKLLDIGREYIKKLLITKKISGIVPGEIGIEGLVLEIASEMSLPVLDGDITGGRAVPEIQDDIFCIYNISTTPVICINLAREVLIIDKTKNLNLVEKFIRNFAIFSNGPVMVFDHLSDVEKFRKISLGTISRSIKLGGKIRNEAKENRLDEILRFNRQYKIKKVAEGKIISISEYQKPGFMKKVVKGKNWQVFIKNECLGVVVNNKIVNTSPDIITIINKENNQPIHNSQLKQGMEVIVLSMRSHKSWYTKKGLEIFGINFFKTEFKDLLPQSLERKIKS